MKKNSSEIFADFYTDIPSGGKRMALAFGVHSDTATAWARRKPSDIFPTATGKGNPVDQCVRAMTVIHPHDPARAREIADYLDTVCDDLDRDAGLAEAEDAQNPCAAIARVVESLAKLVKVSLGNCENMNADKLDETYKKTLALVSQTKQLESCLQQLVRIKNGDE